MTQAGTRSRLAANGHRNSESDRDPAPGRPRGYDSDDHHSSLRTGTEFYMESVAMDQQVTVTPGHGSQRSTCESASELRPPRAARGPGPPTG